jgi:hypothetical protein
VTDIPGLKYQPGASVSPAGPVPPAGRLPTPAAVRAVIRLVPEGTDPSLSAGVRNALEIAAVKLEKDDVIEALAMLRSAQSHLYSASRKDAGTGRPAVYGVAAVPPAEQSSALAKMQRAYQDQAGAWRKAGFQVAALIDQVRRYWFRGRVNGFSPNVRV